MGQLEQSIYNEVTVTIRQFISKVLLNKFKKVKTMITKSFGRYTKKQKRSKKIKKVAGLISYFLSLLAIGTIYAVVFFWLFYNYLPQ